MVDKAHSDSLASMLEGEWKPIRHLTFAQGVAAASILRAYLVDEPLRALEAATRLVQSHPSADVADCFCDGIAMALSLRPEERPGALVRMHSNCQFAAGAS